MKSKAFWKASIVATAALVAMSSQASTEAQKQAAIDSGLAWLASQQNTASGYWCESGYCAADTSSALLAFIEQKNKPGGWGSADYSATVSRGLQYLMDTASPLAISAQKNIGTGGSPNLVASDMNGNLKALTWGGNESTYVTGLVLPALARATAAGLGITPTTTVVSSNAAVNGRSYVDIIQDAADAFIWGQTTQGNAAIPGFRGGWRYTPSTGQSDGSTAQWGAIGLTFAQSVPGVVVPQYVKDELRFWIDYIQCSSNGGAGYDQPCGGSAPVTPSKTGGLLASMAFAGYDGTKPGDTLGRTQALNYLNSNWTSTANSTWEGNFGHPYAMWSVYKGLEAEIGLTGTAIDNFMYGAAAQVKDNASDPWNWWEDYSQYLVNSQNAASGYWNGYSYWGRQLSTAWAINILNATQIGDHNAPEPGTLALIGLGLAAATAAGRRRKAL